MIGFIKWALADVDGNASTKRVLTTIVTLTVCIVALHNAFFHGPVDSLSTLATLAGSGFAAIAAERWGKSFRQDSNSQTPQTNP